MTLAIACTAVAAIVLLAATDTFAQESECGNTEMRIGQAIHDFSKAGRNDLKGMQPVSLCSTGKWSTHDYHFVLPNGKHSARLQGCPPDIVERGFGDVRITSRKLADGSLEIQATSPHQRGCSAVALLMPAVQSASAAGAHQHTDGTPDLVTGVESKVAGRVKVKFSSLAIRTADGRNGTVTFDLDGQIDGTASGRIVMSLEGVRTEYRISGATVRRQPGHVIVIESTRVQGKGAASSSPFSATLHFVPAEESSSAPEMTGSIVFLSSNMKGELASGDAWIIGGHNCKRGEINVVCS